MFMPGNDSQNIPRSCDLCSWFPDAQMGSHLVQRYAWRSLLEQTGTQASWLPASCLSHHTLGPYIWNLPEFRKSDEKSFFSPMGSFGKWFRWNGLTGNIQLQGSTLGRTRKAGGKKNHVYRDPSCLGSSPRFTAMWLADLGQVPETQLSIWTNKGMETSLKQHAHRRSGWKLNKCCNSSSLFQRGGACSWLAGSRDTAKVICLLSKNILEKLVEEMRY